MKNKIQFFNNDLILLVIFLFISLSSYGQVKPNDTIISKSKAIKEQESTRISIIQLIANPEKYHGKRVTAEGYLILEFEGTALYLGREDYEHGLRKNAVWVDIKADRSHIYHKEYASITGVFDKNINGHFGAFSGCLKDISFGYRKE